MKRPAVLIPLLLVIAGVAALGAWFFLPRVDLDDARHHGTELMRLGYPGDWTLAPQPTSGDAEAVRIEGDRGAVTVRLFPSTDDPQQLVGQGVRRHPGAMSALDGARSVDAMGRYEGYGVEMKLAGGIGGRLVRLFVAEVSDGWRLEIEEDYPALTISRLEPGLELVRNTLTVYPPDADERRSAPREP